MKRQHPDNPDLFWCPECKTYKERKDFYYDKKGFNNIGCRCKVCVCAHVKKWAKNNPDKKRQWVMANKDKVYHSNSERYKLKKDQYNKQIKQYAKMHPEIHRKASQNYSLKNRQKINIKAREGRQNLSDSYLRSKLTRDKMPITPEIIELKRQQIIMKRTMKEFKNWVEENDEL